MAGGRIDDDAFFEVIGGVIREAVRTGRRVRAELATNAVVHACSPFSVAVRADESAVRISVRDASHAVPKVGAVG